MARRMTFDISGEYDVRLEIQPAVGVEFYLIEVDDTSRGTGWLYLTKHAGRTNLSHERRVYGFLGSTNNISSEAKGRWRIERVEGSVLTVVEIEDE
jgi:hypothetical protein